MSDIDEAVEPVVDHHGAIRRNLRACYQSTNDFNFVKTFRWGLIVALVVSVISTISLFANGLNLGIDFEGGSVWEVPSDGASVEDARGVMTELDAGSAKIQLVTNADGTEVLRIQADVTEDAESRAVTQTLAEFGGVTTAKDLRRIADVADKYNIPTVKVTGGQRIDLLGVKKEDLPKVWADLDMPSGHAYAKALRTVKTCVGSEWCRFGVQDSTQMGIDLERELWKMYAPHKVKIAVSGCPRNCAESGIKDVGIIGVDSGWEIYVAGNGGIKTVVAQFLVKVKTHDEVLEYAGAFLQLYREEARYLDRTVHYVERVGLEYVKQKMVGDIVNRKALYERLLYALQDEKDPWKKDNVNQREFTALTI